MQKEFGNIKKFITLEDLYIRYQKELRLVYSLSMLMILKMIQTKLRGINICQK